MSNLISAVAWVKRGVALQHPQKYVLDDNELQRVSALAHIELEDARVEMQRAHNAALEMGKRSEDDEIDEDLAESDGGGEWVESVFIFSLSRSGAEVGN
jgi:periodic tryptophan protein 1